MYFISLRDKLTTEENTPRAITSRSIFANQISTWFSHRCLLQHDTRQGARLSCGRYGDRRNEAAHIVSDELSGYIVD